MLLALYGVIALILSFLASQFIFGGDSAEFALIGHTWSIPHPPGYPLYSFLANCITHFLPFGTIPWRVALLSVIPTVLTSLLIYTIAQILQVRRFIAFLSSLIYIVLFPVWEYALVPEVFALNAFLVSLVTYLLIHYTLNQKTYFLTLAFFTLGLCVAHHHTFVIFIPGWIVLVWKHIPTIKRRYRVLLTLLGTTLLGALFYLYVPIAGNLNPPIQWEDGTTVNGFWRLITRAAYGTFSAYAGSKWNFLNQLNGVTSFFILLLQDFRILGIIFIIRGVMESVRRHREPVFRFLIITTCIYIFFLFWTNFVLTTSFTVGMYERFLILFYVVLSIYFALGAEKIAQSVHVFIEKKSKKTAIRLLAQNFISLVLIILGITVALNNWRTIRHVKYMRDFDRLGRDIIATVPKGGIFFAGSDNPSFTTQYHVFETFADIPLRFLQVNFIGQKRYIQFFKKRHPDLRYPSSFRNKNDLQKFFAFNIKYGVYLDGPMPYGMWMPYGLMWKYYQTEKEALSDLPYLVEQNRVLWNTVYEIPRPDVYKKNLLHLQTVQDFYIEAYIRYSRLLFLVGERQDAANVLKKIISSYRPSDTGLKQTLRNLVEYDKKCKQNPPLCKTSYTKLKNAL
jgi:hypothetical protein